MASILHVTNAAPASQPWGELAVRDSDLETRNMSDIAGEKRATAVIPCIRYTELVGNGSPHQVYLHRQVTENTICDPSNTCGVEVSYTHTYEWSVSVGFLAFQWISGGFQVGESWGVADTHPCGSMPGETVCIWYRMAHTAYTVRNAHHGDCVDLDQTPFEIISPNLNNKGGGAGFYCVNGYLSCRSINDQYWELNGPTGGPQA